jgi:hypothetical protein
MVSYISGSKLYQKCYKKKLYSNRKMYRSVTTVQQVFYNEYINVKMLKLIGINTWLMYLSINEKPSMSKLYSFIFHYLEENKLKIFRWKLLQYIIPAKKQPLKWIIGKNTQCNFMWSRWRLSTLLYYLFLSERILGEKTKILTNINIENVVSLKHCFSV